MCELSTCRVRAKVKEYTDVSRLIMHSDYIETRNGGYVAGTRISLDSIVSSFNGGQSPEAILADFPTQLKRSQVYGAIRLLPGSPGLH